MEREMHQDARPLADTAGSVLLQRAPWSSPHLTVLGSSLTLGGTAAHLFEDSLGLLS